MKGAYYNEHDKFAADWLRSLIAGGHIADGDVDTRSICDVQPDDLRSYTQAHFFAGIGGWSLALRLAGWPDDRPIWTGSCPCQPFSNAGRKGGFSDSRHLWPEFHWLIGERRPSRVFGEQVASASDWLRLVRGNLEALEYAVGAMPIEAASAGADHLRDRYWFTASDVGDSHVARSQGRDALPECADQWIIGADGVADTDCIRAGQHTQIVQTRQPQFSGCGDLFHVANGAQLHHHEREHNGSSSDQSQTCAELGNGSSTAHAWVIGADGKARRVKPGIRLLAHGIPGRVGKLRGFGNAIDPRPAAAFIRATAA